MGTPKLGTVCPLSYPLWSGRRAALANPLHCDLPLLNGYFPFRPPRGTCEVRGASPNLWLVVVPALGFRIASLRFPDGPFVDLCGAVCPGASIIAATLRRCNRLTDLVFLDLLSLPSVSRLATSYWRVWTVPHVFLSGGGTRTRPLREVGAGLPRSPPGPHQAGRSGRLGSRTARQAGQPRAVGGWWYGTRLPGRRRHRHPLTLSRGSPFNRRCWIGSPRSRPCAGQLAPGSGGGASCD